MSEFRLNMMVSLDGFVAGPEQGQAVEAPGVTHIRYRVGAT